MLPCSEAGEGDRAKQEVKRGEASAEKDKSSLATYQVSLVWFLF